MNEFLETEYNPDVLECIANLSNDEVFTPPKIANAMLDLLPKELFCNPNTKFLDPCCKSGVFLREIAKRFLKGLKEQIPDLQERIDHIFKNQIYGISLTNLTSLLSRRSVYCAKKANSKYSVTEFNNACGNIFFSEENHFWINGKCLHCGISESSFNTQFSSQSEKHAYQFIHERLPGEIENMKFDVIIGNPPYQMSDGGSGNGISAKPIYQYFVQQAKKLNPRFLSMIIPARWYAGGKGLEDFRTEMLSDKHIIYLVDYPKSRDCFTGVDIAGGVCYFLRDRDNENICKIISKQNNTENMSHRFLDEFNIFIRDNVGIDIIHKILSCKETMMNSTIFTRNPFGFVSSERGEKNKFNGSIKLISSDGEGYVNRSSVLKNYNNIDKYKVIIGKINPDRGGVNNSTDGKMNVITKVRIVNPETVFTETYLMLGVFQNKNEANNCAKYFTCKFTRLLILLTLSSMNISTNNFQFVPLQNFTSTSDIDWTKSIPEIDAQLYKKYNLTQEEIEFIESMIRPMP